MEEMHFHMDKAEYVGFQQVNMDREEELCKRKWSKTKAGLVQKPSDSTVKLKH